MTVIYFPACLSTHTACLIHYVVNGFTGDLSLPISFNPSINLFQRAPDDGYEFGHH